VLADAALVERLVEPERQIIFRVPWLDNNHPQHRLRVCTADGCTTHEPRGCPHLREMRSDDARWWRH
ncbi:hypothetical protein, partial [Streptomyces aureus]